MAKKCYRTGKVLDKPTQNNAHYVVGEDMGKTVVREQLYLITHTEQSDELLQKIIKLVEDEVKKSEKEDDYEPDKDLIDLAEYSDKEISYKMYDSDEVGGVDTSTIEFDVFAIDSREEVKKYEKVVGTLKKQKEVLVKKPRLVCKEALKDSDKIIW